MDLGTILFIGIALIIQCLVLMLIISSATQTNKKLANEETQIRLLILIADKLNATTDEIDKAVYNRN